MAVIRYQPSNGTEGCMFAEMFCDQCVHEKQSHTGDDNDRACEIILKTMCLDVNDPDYPDEWQYDSENRPTCTKFKKHVWHDPFTGELIEPEEIYEPDPDQLDLFK